MARKLKTILTSRLITYRWKNENTFYAVATELKEGARTVFNYGNTGQAVRASASIPSMFIPTRIGDKEYVDGD